jgi:hypothetical protein
MRGVTRERIRECFPLGYAWFYHRVEELCSIFGYRC